MKKAALVGILLAAFFLFRQCGTRPAVLTIWIGGAPPEVEYWERLIGEFESSSGLDVEVVRQPTDSDQRRQGLVISLEAGQPDPDVFLMDVVWIGQFVHSGWLEPLDEYMATGERSVEPFFQRVVDLADRYEGRLYALPVYVDGGLLYYRADLLEKYGYPGPPQTWRHLVEWSQIIQHAERATNPAFNGFVWQGAQYEGLTCTFLEFAASNGGGLIVDNRLQLDYPVNVDALRFMYDLIHKHQISPRNTFTEMKEEEVRRSFQRGNALFERNWPYAWKAHQAAESPVKGKVGLAPLPRFENGQSASALGGWHIGMSRHSDVRQQAWKLIAFITSYESQKKLVLNLGWNPGRQDVYTDGDVLGRLPHLQQLRDVFENAVARPNLPYYTRISEVIQRNVNGCLAGKMPPREALSAAQAEAQRIISQYGTE